MMSGLDRLRLSPGSLLLSLRGIRTLPLPLPLPPTLPTDQQPHSPTRPRPSHVASQVLARTLQAKSLQWGTSDREEHPQGRSNSAAPPPPPPPPSLRPPPPEPSSSTRSSPTRASPCSPSPYPAAAHASFWSRMTAPRMRPVRLAAMSPTFWPCGASRRTVEE
jgi:hypothetical protein